jgi:monomeric sarcosine oxidase
MTQSFDIAVVGAGVFGSWTAYMLQHAGAKVALIDAFGSANSRASSGGESRIIRLGYGPDEIYTRSARKSLERWQQLFHRLSPSPGTSEQFLHRTGVLWLAREIDPYCDATTVTLEGIGAAFERLSGDEIARRYPQLNVTDVSWGILESEAGILMARRAVQALCRIAQNDGVTYLVDAVIKPAGTGKLESVSTTAGSTISADKFVFACGPWLPKIFPELLADRFQISKQEVFFFGTPPGSKQFNPDHLPAWIDFNDLIYGVPNIDNRGFKLAVDAHGPDFDPDNGSRVTTAEALDLTRSYLAKRLPAMADAPVVETRVCQYENTSTGDFLIDAHPEFSNVWIVGGGSGHGFKHGPTVGEYVVGMISGEVSIEPRFSLASKDKVQHRQVY